MSGNGGALAYGAVAGLVVYYSAYFQFVYAGKQRRRRKLLYGTFFALAMATVVLEMLQILVDASDVVSHTVLMYGVIGPVVDLLWGTWPGNGAAMLLASQTVFSVHNTPDLLGVLMIVVAFFTASVMGAGWWYERRVYRRYYPLAVSVQVSM